MGRFSRVTGIRPHEALRRSGGGSGFTLIDRFQPVVGSGRLLNTFSPRGPSIEYRQNIVVAAAWHVAAQLMRRHHVKSKLRLILAHPCGGQYRQLWVMTDRDQQPFFESLLGLSLTGGNAHSFADGSKESSIPYIDSLISSRDPSDLVDRVESMMRLPSSSGKPIPASTPSVITTRAMAAIFRQFMFSRTTFEAECGWFDSSGISGSGINDRLRPLESFCGQLPSDQDRWETRARATSKFWLLGPMTDDGLDARIVVSMSGKAASLSNPGQPINLTELYRLANNRVAPVAEALLELADCAP